MNENKYITNKKAIHSRAFNNDVDNTNTKHLLINDQTIIEGDSTACPPSKTPRSGKPSLTGLQEYPGMPCKHTRRANVSLKD